VNRDSDPNLPIAIAGSSGRPSLACVSAWLIIALLLSACATVSVAPHATAVRRVSVNGAELSYTEQGAGETVVLMHGTATDYRIWDAVRRELAGKFRVVAYSRRHHAPNAWPDDGDTYTMIQHAEDLVALIRALGVDRAHIVAVSMGARVAAHVAVHHPEVVRTVTLNDGILATPQTETGRRVMEEIAPKFDVALEQVQAGKTTEAVATYVDLASQSGWQGLPAALREYFLDNARTFVLATRDRTLRPPTCEALGSVRVPVLVLAGEKSVKVIEVTNEALMTCLPPTAELAKIPNAGHYWYAENAGDASRLLMDFLKRHSGK
jgi:pimeloyl-ACP methyl ester carboxylesterase